MKFCTAVCCIDGRIQLPVIRFMQQRFNAEYVDMVNEAGADRVLGDHDNDDLVKSILTKVDISINAHGSLAVAIIGHYDCAANPVTEPEHLEQIQNAVIFLRNLFHDTIIIGLWVDESWHVNEIEIED
jgi:carbonic anhydrase